MLMTEIRLLSPAEARDESVVEQIVRVVNAAYAVGEAGLWVDGWTRTNREEIADAIRSNGLLAATADGEIVGCAYVQAIDADTADLGLVSAALEHRGSGIGRELVQSAEELMRSRGVTTAQLELLVPKDWKHPEKERLRAWYTRLGYEVVRVATVHEIAAQLPPQLATPCEFLVFQKTLG
jgi:ribosomal protein S18 acetylase RimI-like enzyme